MQHLKRYFCEADKVHQIQKDYVFIEPGEHWGAHLLKPTEAIFPRPWDYYEFAKSIVLLGPPRQGKTTEFKHQCSKATNGFYLPLRKLPTRGGLQSFADVIEGQAIWGSWITGNETGEIFIDALDEGKISTPQMMTDLVAWIFSLGQDIINRLRINISCRTADWSRLDKDEWHDLFPSTDNKDNVVVLELLDLDRKQYIEYCQSQGIDPFELLKNIPMRAKQFVARPLTLQMVVEDFRTTGQVPTDTKDLYDRAIERRLAEHNRAYQRQRAVPATAQRRIAEYYALLTILSGREIIAAHNIDPSLHIPARIGEGFDGNEEAATFMSGIFRSDIHGQYRFDDLEIAEYLAACQMNRNINAGTITPKIALSLFISQAGQKEPVPCLRGTMVWLCAINPAFRQLTINLNPEVLLYDYPGEMPPDDKLRIWEWLKTKFADRVYFDDGAWYYGAGAIACPELFPELAEALEDPEHYGRDLRILALRVVSQGKLTQIIPILEKCLQRTDDNPHFIKYAADALAELSPEKVDVLKNWLKLPPEKDPDNQLLGTALEYLWPNHISADELVLYLRPQYGNLHGRYQRFLHSLPPKLNPEERATVIRVMVVDLENILIQKDAYALTSNQYRPCSDLLELVKLQINDWKEDEDHLADLEYWATIALRGASRTALFFYEKDPKLKDILTTDHKLRQSLQLKYIQRIYQSKGDDFDSNKFVFLDGLRVQSEDLTFWKDVVEKWENKDHRLFLTALKWLYWSWDFANNPIELVEWLETKSESNSQIKSWWEQHKQCNIPPDEYYWQREDAQREKKRILKRQDDKQSLLQHLEDVKKGHIGLLYNLICINRIEDDGIVERYGEVAYEAFQQGLIVAWEKMQLPSLDEYYPGKSLYGTIITLHAIRYWASAGDFNWDAISERMRTTAIQASFSEYNEEQEWLSSLIQSDEDTFRKLALEALSLEDEHQKQYATFANRLKRMEPLNICREISLEFLKNNPNANQLVAIPLASGLSNGNISGTTLDFLTEYGQHRLANNDESIGLHFLAEVWRYRPHDTWLWINDNFLLTGDNRAARFDMWINAIHNAHGNGSDHWPGWVMPEALVDILPDFYMYFPVSGDTSIDEYNRGDADIKHRDHLARFRSDAISTVANSGTPIARDLLLSIINNPEYRNSRDSLLIHLDRWERAQAEKSWSPLLPNELLEVLTEGKRPLRNHQELFELVLEIVGDIKAEMEGGQSNLKRLCWIHPTEKGVKPTPADETNLQIVLGREIANHPLRRNIVGNREVTVTGENHPDLKVETILESGQTAIVYIEVKRQMHPEVLTALETQLANKYLIVPEARNGIYFVGWYGDSDEYWRASQASRRNICGSLPAIPHELEICLQSKASIIMDQRTDIDNIKAVVVDLSL